MFVLRFQNMAMYGSCLPLEFSFFLSFRSQSVVKKMKLYVLKVTEDSYVERVVNVFVAIAVLSILLRLSSHTFLYRQFLLLKDDRNHV